MNIADIKAFIESKIAAAADDIKQKVADVFAWLEHQDADAQKVQAEIADLTARGYTVTPPQAPATIGAPIQG